MSQTELLALLAALAAVCQGAWMNITNWLDKRDRRRREQEERDWKRQRELDEIAWRRETERYRREMEAKQDAMHATATRALTEANNTNRKLVHLGYSPEKQREAERAALADSI